ncbi:MAG: PilZ domain-containing protein [Burkholderiaceae bacterium]
MSSHPSVSGPATEPGRTSSLINLSIRDRAALRAAYMPFIEGGGLFVPTNRAARMGDDLYLIMTLPDDPTKHAVSGKVVWITPNGSGSRQQGLGVQFARTEAGEQIRSRIETLIAGQPRNAAPTHTF